MMRFVGMNHASLLVERRQAGIITLKNFCFTYRRGENGLAEDSER
jgi:hypothetical protein